MQALFSGRTHNDLEMLYHPFCRIRRILFGIEKGEKVFIKSKRNIVKIVLLTSILLKFSELDLEFFHIFDRRCPEPQMSIG